MCSGSSAVLLEGSWNLGAEQELCSQTAQGLCRAIPHQTSNHRMPSLHSFPARLLEGAGRAAFVEGIRA